MSVSYNVVLSCLGFVLSWFVLSGLGSRYVYAMQNMSFGPDGGLTEACRLKHPSEPHLCFMSPHMVDTIQVCLSVCETPSPCQFSPTAWKLKGCRDRLGTHILRETQNTWRFAQTPLFMLNSRFDRWQLNNILQTDWATEPAQRRSDIHTPSFQMNLLLGHDRLPRQARVKHKEH